LFHFVIWFFAEPEKQEQNRSKAIEHLREAVEFFERVGDSYLAGQSHVLWGYFITYGEECKRHLKKSLEYYEETHDNYWGARALDFLAFNTYWDAHGAEDPDDRRKLAEEAMEFYDRAQHLYSVMSFQVLGMGKTRAPTPGGFAEYYLDSAEWETDREKKLELLDKSERAGLKALTVAEDSDIPTSIFRMNHILSRTLAARARLEPDVDAKRSLLEKALKHRERSLEIYEQWAPFYYWNLAVWHNLLGNVKAELAFIQPGPESRRSLLEDAVSSMEKSLQTFNKIMPYYEKRGARPVFASLTNYQDDAARTLIHLYEETNDQSHLRRAIEIWREEIESAEKGEMVSRIAESHWQIAKAQDILGEHPEAAESFQRASESYIKAAEKIPQLKEFYQEYASYMRAWSEIEKAKRHHAEKRHGEARGHYEKAAELHKSTERWSYLAPNYQAWAMLEEAEDLSREEQTEEAKGDFEMAASLFLEAKDSIQTNLEGLEGEEEKEIAGKLVKASGVRRQYCLGRVALEEARILDRRGDHTASSRKYGQATEKYQEVIDAMELESDRRELRPIVYLCQAWQKMMMAESRASPGLYGEAAELFIEAKDYALDQTTSHLAQAHSSFCRALEAGTEFEITRDTNLHDAATRHLESAANFYLRAGVRTASEYAKATQRLFDAYVYMGSAKNERNPGEKTRFYQMAERLLQVSAGSFLKAKHPEKSEEIRRVLESVKEEKEIAMSLSEVLHAPAMASATASFYTPTQTHERAVGLERFESADIQANIILGRGELKVGEDLEIEIELVNAGRAPAQLIKVEEIIPAGFEVKRAPEACRVEDSFIDMKGRSLSPLKTEELKLVLKPMNKGTFNLRPRILFLDESGKYRSHEPEPATIEVRELGIKGWLKGPTR
jgi:tetratricopeptide (TPR) repeat protein